MTLYETISRLAQQIENGTLTGERDKELLFALEEWLYSDEPCGPRDCPYPSPTHPSHTPSTHTGAVGHLVSLSGTSDYTSRTYDDVGADFHTFSYFSPAL